MIGPVEAVVGPGIELVDFGWSGLVDIDISDTTILITLNMNQPAGYAEVLRLADANGTVPDFTGVTVNPATDYAGFDASRVQVSANSVDIQLTGLQGLQGQQISLELTGAPPPETLPAAVDIRPGRCLNFLLNAGLLPVVIRGSGLVDVAQIDRASVRLDGVAPVWSNIVVTGETSCTAADSLPDLLLWFRADEIAAVLGPVTFGEIRVLSLTGQLSEESGATPIQGQDAVIVAFTQGPTP